MKKNVCSVLLLMVLPFCTNAQILRVATSTSTIASKIPGYSQVSTINTKTVSYTPPVLPTPLPPPVEGDTTTEVNKGYDYADVIAVNVTMSDGNITSTSLGKVWTVRLSIPNALNIGLLFNQFNLSPTAQLYIFNDARTALDSCIKKSDFSYSATIGIMPMTGNGIIVYILEPNNFGTFQSSIAMQSAEAGYKPVTDVGTIYGSRPIMGAPQTLDISCMPVIQCSQSKMPYARTVARFNTNGKFGTGTFLNNEANNGRPYFLTAFHVVDKNKNNFLDASEIAALAGARFQAQFWRRTCNGTELVSGLEFSGAILRGSVQYTDFVLLEILNAPGIGDNVNYIGWNLQTAAPADYSSFVIHHPEAEDMRITSVKNISSWILDNSYWSANYYGGTAVTFGSSGSALLNQNGQVIGQLKSGLSACSWTSLGDRYPKFSISYNLSSATQWLSPIQHLQQTILLNLTDISITGPNIIACTTPAQYTSIGNLQDVTYTWSVSPGLQILSGQGTASVSVSGLSGNQYGSGVLTLTLNSPTKGHTRTKVITKNMTINTNTAATGTYNSPNSNTEVLISPANRFDVTTFNNACLAMLTSMNIPSGATVVWNGTTSSPNVIWNQTGNDVVCYFTAIGQTADFTISVTTSCGTKNTWFRFKCTSNASCGGINPLIVISPNPANEEMRVALTTNNSKDKIMKNGIMEMKIIDKMGKVQQIKKYSAGQPNITLNISKLKRDVYTIMIFDGRQWVSKKFIKN